MCIRDSHRPLHQHLPHQEHSTSHDQPTSTQGLHHDLPHQRQSLSQLHSTSTGKTTRASKGRLKILMGITAGVVIVAGILATLFFFFSSHIQQHPCLSASKQFLSFTSIQGQGNLPAQSVTLTNCGAADSWSGISSTSGGTSWLGIGSSMGNLGSGVSQTVSIAVSSGHLGVGTYRGQITFTTKSGASIVINVTWNLQPSRCIHCGPSGGGGAG